MRTCAAVKEGRSTEIDRVRKSHYEHLSPNTRSVREEDKERKGGGGHERSEQHVSEMS